MPGLIAPNQLQDRAEVGLELKICPATIQHLNCYITLASPGYLAATHSVVIAVSVGLAFGRPTPWRLVG